MSSGETVAQLLVEIGADIQGLLDGMASAKGAVDEFQATTASSADQQDIFGQRVSTRLNALARDYQALGQSEQEAAASAETARTAIEQSVASAAQRRVNTFTPTATLEPLDAAIGTRLEQVAAQYRLLGQSSDEAAASAMRLRPAIEEAVTEQAQARLERLVPALKDVQVAGNPLGEIFHKIGQEMATIGRTALGFATGMLAANVAMGAAARFKDAAEQIDTFGTAVWKVQTVTGETAENSSRLVAIFERFGLTGDVAASKLSRFERALNGTETALDLAESGGKRGAQILADIGVQTHDATGKLLPLSEVLMNLADQWTHLDAESRNAASRTLFGGLGGQGAEQMNLMLSQGRAGFEALSAAANKYGLVLSQENVEDVKKFTFAHRDMDLALQGVALQLGASLMPAVTGAAEGFTRVSQILNQGVMPAIKAIPGLLPAIEVAVLGVSAAFGAKLAVNAVAATAATVRWAVVSSGQAVAAAGKLGLAVAAAAGAFIKQGAAAAWAAATTLADWVAAAAPVVLIIGGIVLAAGALWLALSGKLGDAKDAIGNAFAQLGQALHSAWDVLQNGFKMDGFDAGKAWADQVAGGVGSNTAPIVTASVKAAQAAKDAATAHLQELQDAQASRKLDFDAGHVDMEGEVLNTKLAETQANAQLLEYKRQIEDLDRSAIDFANQRLKLDQQDAITRAQIAESAMKAQDEDLGYQQNLLKAELRASRHGGAPVDSTAIHSELRQLHDQQIRETPGLLIAQHNVTLADRAKQSTDLQGQLRTSSLDRAKIDIEEAMQPFQDAATAAKRMAEDALTALDLEKQKFAIDEQRYQLALLQAQLDAKTANHDLYVAEHADAPAVTIQGGVNVTVQNTGDSQLDHQTIVDAVYKGVTKAATEAKRSAPVVVDPKLGGSRYATG